MEKKKSNMKLQVMWNIRDARGLNVFEKVFLYTVGTRGTCTTSRRRLISDTGMSNSQISRVVASLLEKDLIESFPGRWEEGKQTQTIYIIKEASLAAWLAAHPVPDRDEVIPVGDEVVPVGDEVVPDRDEVVSDRDEVIPVRDEVVPVRAGKVTKKVNSKVTEKKTEKNLAVAGAPATPFSTSFVNDRVNPEALANVPYDTPGFDFDGQAKELGIDFYYQKYKRVPGVSRRKAFLDALTRTKNLL